MVLTAAARRNSQTRKALRSALQRLTVSPAKIARFGSVTGSAQAIAASAGTVTLTCVTISAGFGSAPVEELHPASIETITSTIRQRGIGFLQFILS